MWAVAAGIGGTGRWGPTGWTRMFNDAFGGQISWLLPAALIFTLAGLAFTWKRPRTDRTRAALILWGATLFVTGAVFSLSKGIIHEYYTVALGPAIGALVGIGVATFWPHRAKAWARIVLGVVVVVSVFWANALLERTPDWNPWLRTLVLVGGCALAFTIGFGPALRGRAGGGGRRCCRRRCPRGTGGVHVVDGVGCEGGRDPACRTRLGSSASGASGVAAPVFRAVSRPAAGRPSTARRPRLSWRRSCRRAGWGRCCGWIARRVDARNRAHRAAREGKSRIPVGRGGGRRQQRRGLPACVR